MFRKLCGVFVLLLFSASCQSADSIRKAHIPKGEYVPFFEAEKKPVKMRSFKLDAFPVTQAQYLGFVRANSSWRRSQVKRLLADSDYLKNWKGDDQVQAEKAPVTYVSWFAAKAYCESKGERLPTLEEWEYAARAGGPAANSKSQDEDKSRILSWYSRPSQDVLSEVGKSAPNFYGVYDMHGLIWEWVFDFKSIPKTDGRASGTKFPENLFCAGGAGISGDPSDYAAFMRFAFRSSLKGSYTIKDLGFRCAKGNA